MARTVLICDDSILMRKLIGDALTDDGWEVVGEGCDGLEGAELYKQLRPTAVTMDLVMPGHDGISGLRSIIEFDSAARVVVVSALDQTKTISEAIRYGAFDFIVKPFMPEQLQTTMSNCAASATAKA